MPITINTAKKPAPPTDDSASSGSNGEAGGQKGSKWLSWLIEISIIVVVVLLAFMVRHGLYDVAIVTSSSMEPTLMVGDRVVFDHRQSLYGQWQRGDIVFFDPPETWNNDDPSVVVKRVVGLPGETIEMRQGHVFVNGQEIKEGAQDDAEDNLLPLKLSNNQYFVMGDNRRNSSDSRANGPITKDDIRGRATVRLWPAPGRIPLLR